MRMILLAVLAAAMQAAPWKLPQGMAVKEAGPRTYRVTVDYTISGTQGDVLRRDRVSGLYTRGLPDGEKRWNDASVAQADGADAPFGTPEKRDYMEGFHYGPMNGHEMLKPGFFKNFPPMAFQERDLIWDTHMFESLGQGQFEHLKLNEPYRFASDQELDLGGAGKFRNRDLRVTWTGMSERNGEECAVIDYRAYFNPFSIETAAMKMTARSHYWGQIWVSLKTKQIEYATLYEDVLGEVKMPGQDAPRLVNVFRTGIFEPAKK